MLIKFLKKLFGLDGSTDALTKWPVEPEVQDIPVEVVKKATPKRKAAAPKKKAATKDKAKAAPKAKAKVKVKAKAAIKKAIK
jgi:hypothetical protein